jgi:hypothetical protein
MTIGAMRYLLVTVIGVAVGALSGLMGVGGGFVAVPALVLILGFNQQMAQGTSLLMMLPTALVGAISYSSHRNAHLATAAAMALGSVPAAHFTADLAQRIPEASLRTIFSLFLAAMGVFMVPSAKPGALASVAGVVLIIAGFRLALGR